MTRSIKKKYILFAVAIIYAALSLFLQISPIATSSHFVSDMSMLESDVIEFTGLYFVIYAILQIPNGIAFDKIGLKYIFPLGIFFTLIGSILYWQASDLFFLGLSRIIIGAGCSVSYVAAIFIAARTFQPRNLPICIAILQIATGSAAIFANNSFRELLRYYGWDICNAFIVAFCFILLLVSIAIVKNTGKHVSESEYDTSFKQSMKDVVSLLKNRNLVGIFFYSFFTWLVIMTFAGYWASNYFIHMHHYSLSTSLGLSEIYWLSFLFGNVFVGIFGRTLKASKFFIILLSTIGVVTFIIMAIPVLFDYTGLVAFSICAGISSSGVVIAFSLIPRIAPSNISGTAIALNNTFMVLGGFIGQLIFGSILSGPSLDMSVGINDGYYTALLSLLLSSILAFISLLFTIYHMKKPKVWIQ
ncbi:MAG: putative MFS family arabinose efflux permease [Francisellaceae bacterium]|jgi:predicted MFS family arabinose efflux permease